MLASLAKIPSKGQAMPPALFGSRSAFESKSVLPNPSHRTENHISRTFRKLRIAKNRPYCSETINSASTEQKEPSLVSEEVLQDRQAAVELYRRRTGKHYPPYEFGLEERHITAAQFVERYSNLTPGQELVDLTFDSELVLYGRIESKRQSGKKLAFYNVRQGRDKVMQVVVSIDHFRCIGIAQSEKSEEAASDFALINETLKRGDVIAVRGVPYRTSAGELSLRGRAVELVSPCLHALPVTGSLTNKDTRYRNRHVDLLTNRDSINVFLARSTILNSLRSFLNERNFIEVETPILSPYSGGAAARPFSTHMLAQDAHLYLRIAPELYLKQLIVGGLDRVYEIGKSFRNEGVDTTHNPEFTTCEFYQAYANYEDLMETTQTFLKRACLEVNKTMRPELIGTQDEFSVTIDIPSKDGLPALPGTKIDFSKPFRRINLVEEIQTQLGHPLPDVNDPENAPAMLDILKRLGLECNGPKTTVKMFDVLVEHFVEPQCVQPTFLCNFPLATSPLARNHRSIEGSTERFELFIARMELANAYTELNDPMEQRLRFQNQMPDGESVKTNEDWYCGSLEWGLPPTGGWGMGLDRLTMVLTNRFSIKEVMLFPYMKPFDPTTAPL
jgi:lysyl-tRNA synthetase class 2